jgi:hypothetical protein
VPILPPLEVSDSTLALPRSSTTQDGYLTTDDFLLFARGQVVAVTSFNTRTGEVMLLEDDILAALGYVPSAPLNYTPLNKAGDTMAGALTLASDPVAALEAATRQYVDTYAGTPLGIYRVSAFGASGSKLIFNGSITAGTKTLTLTSSTHDFAVGQGIGIVGAGNLPTVDAASNLLVSKITAIVGAVITIADNALHTVSGAVVKHDDTVAIQNTINACCSAGGGKVLFALAYYRVNKGFSDVNSILRIPQNAYNNPSVPLAFTSDAPPGFLTYAGGPTLAGCAIIQTDLIGAAILSGGYYSNDSADWTTVNNTCVTIENLVFRTYNNPQTHGIDLGACGQYTILRNLTVDTGVPLLTATQPNVGVFGIRLPGNSTSILIECTNVGVYNYGTGIIASEIAHFTNTIIMLCKVGMQLVSGYHLLTGRFLIWHCPTVIEFANTTTIPHVISFQIDVEEAFAAGGDPAWTVPAANHSFYDPGDLAVGRIDYIAVQGYSGAFQTVGFTGMSRVIQGNLGNLT